MHETVITFQSCRTLKFLSKVHFVPGGQVMAVWTVMQPVQSRTQLLFLIMGDTMGYNGGKYYYFVMCRFKRIRFVNLFLMFFVFLPSHGLCIFMKDLCRRSEGSFGINDQQTRSVSVCARISSCGEIMILLILVVDQQQQQQHQQQTTSSRSSSTPLFL